MTAEDVIVGILFHMKKRKINRLTADREKLHSAFYKMRDKYPQVMSFFSFREREVFPESIQLDQALSNLDATGLISRQNLTPRYYSFEDSLGNSYKNILKYILPAAGIKEDQLKKLADNIAELVKDLNDDAQRLPGRRIQKRH